MLSNDKLMLSCLILSSSHATQIPVLAILCNHWISRLYCDIIFPRGTSTLVARRLCSFHVSLSGGVTRQDKFAPPEKKGHIFLHS
jgi:hypothetical protein